MTDILDRLQSPAFKIVDGKTVVHFVQDALNRQGAIDEIRRLRARVAELEAIERSRD